MPQFQYQPVAFPPEQTPPATDALGWDRSNDPPPQTFMDRREYRGRGGGYRGLYDTQSHAVFAVENWAVLGNTIGKSYEPANPQQFIERREYRGRGGGYRALYDTQSHAIFAVENWTPPLGWGTEFPDRPHLTINRRDLRWRGGGYQSLFDAVQTRPDPVVATTPFFLTELPDDPLMGRRRQLNVAALYESDFGTDVAVPVMSWTGSWPDVVIGRRRALGTDKQPASFRVEIQAAAPQVFGWSAEYSDTTRRLSLHASALPSSFRGEAPEPWAPTLLWSASYPERVPLLKPQTRIEGFSFALQDLVVVVPALSWNGLYPDRTWRPALKPSAIPSTFRGEALEQFAQTLLATTTYPDRVPFLRPQTRLDGFSFAHQDLTVVTPALSWGPAYPDRTRRVSLATHELPSLFKGEAVEHFARTLLSTTQYPDRTWRNALPSGLVPAVFRGEAPESYRPTLWWSARYPDRTMRATLMPALRPSRADQVFIPPAVPAYLCVVSPETTSRHTLPVHEMPSLSLSWMAALLASIADVRVLPMADDVVVMPAADGGGPTTARYQATVLADRPILYYRFLEDYTGVTYGAAVDTSPHALNGLYVRGDTDIGFRAGGPTLDGDPGLTLSGTSLVSRGDDPLLHDLTSVSVELWIRASTVPPPAPPGVGVMQFNVPHGLRSGRGIDVHGLGGSAVGVAWWLPLASGVYGEGPQPVPFALNTWHQFVGVWDANAPMDPVFLIPLPIQIYWDGVLMVADSTGAPETLSLGTNGLAIGNPDANVGASTDVPWTHDIGQFALYDTALSAADVLDHFQTMRPDMGAVLIVPPDDVELLA